MNLPRRACDTCGRAVVWALTRTQRRIALEPTPTSEGFEVEQWGDVPVVVRGSGFISAAVSDRRLRSGRWRTAHLCGSG